MEANGFKVTEKLHDNMNAVKSRLGLNNPNLYSCHTAEIDGYVFEGHIPAEDIKAFLDDPPKEAKGLTVPDMPIGSPGMEHGEESDSYTVYAFNGQNQIFKYSNIATTKVTTNKIKPSRRPTGLYLIRQLIWI
ncbi:hypothetical protein VSA01S_29300 [Vibrio sagamiensis NBRC 104589]|uniref:Uncharacterized protein n=1 Tax=Vibrio sagamiensis NBRC 104589 TaxID=1219064 RepID=A0A511QHN9_9VIBR|nr:hypothetical protein VSA01S_29300 [Vibrio sagamiensis NBRC 104589]